ncbi:DUF4249 domain-containing protein [Hymenobacter cheonanensis]|uniref:DUF4249 domain-containing protein n=1 Tax=Hymenobacter sp. CA2-7 TaxID=3063993 RepID=UPI002713D7CD|nr:DUF4249 domain-containing protein [Hymenobacter sp. CA2-7]MDO7883895.1 DUF4249 domain-containing protein [Hymenobacter sp. CA2-7]
MITVHKGVAGMLLLGALGGCKSLQNDANVPLPYYANQLVAECYLENGVVPRLTISESVPYLDNNQAIAAGSQVLTLPNGQTVQLPTDVTVTLTLPGGQPVPLRFSPGIDAATGKYYTHVGAAPIVAKAGQQFGLDAQDKRGRHLTGTAIVPTFIPIDSVKYKFNGLTGENKKAYFLTKWTDPAATIDFYRLMLHKGKPANNSETDNDIRDKLFNGQPYAQVTTYRFRPGDTVTATLYHVDTLYFDFRQSVRNARNANGNPFAQPSGIHSTVQGGLGVFTVLVSDKRTVILN